MRIGFLGNTNNFPFMLAQALRRRGHDVLFLVDQSDPLYRPEAKFPEIWNASADWIVDVSPLRFRDYLLPSVRMSRVVALLRGCDAVVLNQYAPSLLSRIGRPAMLMLTGSDLDFFANPDAIEDAHRRASSGIFRKHLEHWIFRRLSRKQRLGITLAGVISYFPKGVVPAGDRLLSQLGVKDDSRIFIPMTDVHAILPSPLPFNSPARVVCVARLNWKKPMRPGTSQLDYKGTDVMLQGLAKYIAESGARLDIQLLRKGLDVPETEQLVSALRLNDHVTWHEEMTQADLLDMVRQSDVVIDQLAESLPGSGGVDAMALGRPVIANWRADVIPIYNLPPEARCQASSPGEVCVQLGRLLSDRGEMARVADAGRKYVEQKLSSDAAALVCEERLRALVGGGGARLRAAAA
jgi:glycosyltransferase involved in cell wall biosynthesis